MMGVGHLGQRSAVIILSLMGHFTHFFLGIEFQEPSAQVTNRGPSLKGRWWIAGPLPTQAGFPTGKDPVDHPECLRVHLDHFHLRKARCSEVSRDCG